MRSAGLPGLVWRSRWPADTFSLPSPLSLSKGRMLHASRLALVGAALVFAGCAEGLFGPSAPEANLIYANAVQGPISTAQGVLQGGGSTVTLNGTCQEGTRTISGTVTAGASTSQAQLNLTSTLNNCVYAPPDGTAGRFILSGTVTITGTIGTPTVEGNITWSNSVTSGAGNCTPRSTSVCD